MFENAITTFISTLVVFRFILKNLTIIIVAEDYVGLFSQPNSYTPNVFLPYFCLNKRGCFDKATARFSVIKWKVMPSIFPHSVFSSFPWCSVQCSQQSSCIWVVSHISFFKHNLNDNNLKNNSFLGFKVLFVGNKALWMSASPLSRRAKSNLNQSWKISTTTKVYNIYQGPKIVSPFHLLLVLKNLDDFKIWTLTSKCI